MFQVSPARPPARVQLPALSSCHLKADDVQTTGTTRYFDDPDRPQAATEAHRGLKVDNSGDVPIILVSCSRNYFATGRPR